MERRTLARRKELSEIYKAWLASRGLELGRCVVMSLDDLLSTRTIHTLVDEGDSKIEITRERWETANVDLDAELENYRRKSEAELIEKTSASEMITEFWDAG